MLTTKYIVRKWEVQLCADWIFVSKLSNYKRNFDAIFN